jgi:hypothetical protein
MLQAFELIIIVVAVGVVAALFSTAALLVLPKVFGTK